MYPYFNILGRTVGSYAICAFAGLFVSAFVAHRLSKGSGILFEDIILVILTVGGGVLAGGHLLYAVTNADKLAALFAATAKSIKNGAFSFSRLLGGLQTCFGGSVFYGGFIGAFIALSIYIKVTKFEKKELLTDIFAVCVPLFHAFGRIGCFLGGCCYGIKSNFGFTAHNTLLPEMTGVRRLPVSLFESAFNFLLFLFLMLLFKKRVKSGKLIYVYMIIYPMGRFVLEFFRGDKIRGMYLCFSTSQWISIFIFAYGVFMLAKYRLGARKHNMIARTD